MDQNNNQNEQVNNSNGLAVAGLIVAMVSILIPFMGLTGGIGLVFSIIGLIQSKGKKVIYKVYSILGIIIAVVGIIYGIYVLIDALPQLKESLNETASVLKIVK
ncbi:MAG: hypothetical protein IKE91_00655 [Clostridia bacterium]|nr:hypothetical protein [Clostridia bacterium]